MKFKICGDLDAPEWILKEISILAKISYLRVKFLANGVVNHLLGDSIDYAKVAAWTSKANLDASDVKAMVAALTFIIRNAVKYNLEVDALVEELQQMGMPKEHSEALIKPYTTNKEKLQEQFMDDTLRLARLDSVSWRVDYVLSTNQNSNVNQPSVQLQMSTMDGDTEDKMAFDIQQDKFRVFVQGSTDTLRIELRAARAMMDNVR